MSHQTRIQKPIPVESVVSFYELSAELNAGKMDQFSHYQGRITLIVNIATGDKNATKELKQLNELTTSYISKGLVVLAFPCNQFGGLEPYEDDEIPLIMKAVKPGCQFTPLFKLFKKCDINGSNTHPVYQYLKLKQPQPSYDNGTLATKGHFVSWSPVSRFDIAWNFEKFLVNYDGQLVKRYTWKAPVELVKKDIEFYLKKIPRHVRDELGLVK